jgi:DNA-binding beta-propeller fold protein YncE
MSSISNTFLTVDMKSGRQQNPYTTKESPHRATSQSTNSLYLNQVLLALSIMPLVKLWKLFPVAKAHKVDITADGSEIWVTNSNENTIGIIDPKKQTNPENKTGNESLWFKVFCRWTLLPSY